MDRAILACLAAAGLASAASRPDPVATNMDPRNINRGAQMLSSDYLDQPYCIVSTHPSFRGEWLCLITQDSEHEGGKGEHVLALRSADEGRTWSATTALEGGTTITNAYSAPVQEETSGRVMAVYNMNVHNISSLPSGKPLSRTDELGAFRARYSDDNGRSWSEPWELPLPTTAIDLGNSWAGKVQIFWNVDVFHTWPVPGQAWPAAGFFFTKIGVYPQSPPEEDFVMVSADLLRPGIVPANATWVLAPNATDAAGGAGSWRGLLPPNGNPAVFEEPHLLPLPSGSGFWMEARTTQGFLAAAATGETHHPVGGWPGRASFARHWVPTRPGADDEATAAVAAAAASAGASGAVKAAVAAAGAAGLASTGLVKQPRGPTQLRRLSPTLPNGTTAAVMALLYYSNSETGYSGGSRNPYWLALGTEVAPAAGGAPDVVWSQPEVVLYDRLYPEDRPGYPDMLVRASDGAVVITETNKSVARTHVVAAETVAALLRQRTQRLPATRGQVARLGASPKGAPGNPVPVPALSSFAPYNASGAAGDGLTVELVLRDHSSAAEGDVVASSLAAAEGGPPAGIEISVAAGGALTLRVNGPDGGSLLHQMDALCGAALSREGPHSVAAVADSSARLVLWVVDGTLCDGAEQARGWGWFNTDASDDPVSSGGSGRMLVAPSYGGSIVGGRVYNRALLVSELVGNFRAGVEAFEAA